MNWRQCTASSNENWMVMRASLMKVMVSGHAMGGASCMNCAERTAVVRSTIVIHFYDYASTVTS